MKTNACTQKNLRGNAKTYLPGRAVSPVPTCELSCALASKNMNHHALATNTSVLLNAYWVLESALHQTNQSFERSRRKREPKMFHSTKCSKPASKDSPLDSSWAPTWLSKSTQNRLKARGFARHQTSSSLSASLFTRQFLSGLHF